MRRKSSVHPIDSCGARDFLTCRRKSRPLRPHRLASSATGGASALRLPTSPAQSASIRLLSGSISWRSTRNKKKTPSEWMVFLFGSPCWARTNDTAVNSSRLFLSINFAGYIISDLPVNTGLCGSNGIMTSPLFSHSPKFRASFRASGKLH